jgi:hypothetical protein
VSLTCTFRALLNVFLSVCFSREDLKAVLNFWPGLMKNVQVCDATMMIRITMPVTKKEFAFKKV